MGVCGETREKGRGWAREGSRGGGTQVGFVRRDPCKWDIVLWASRGPESQDGGGVVATA